MKKLTKITALVLALALVLGMTTFAQSTLLLVEKFDYADAGVYLNSLTTSGVTEAANPNGSVFDVAAFREAGTLKGRSGTYMDTASNGSIGTNFRGNKQFLSGNDSSNKHAYMYLLPSSWNAKDNADKSLIVSFETSPSQTIITNYSSDAQWFSMIGYNGTEYKGAIGMSTYNGGGALSIGYQYTALGYDTMSGIPAETTQTQAVEYKWDAELNQVVKAMIGVDGKKRWNDGYGYSDNLANYTTVDGVSIFFAKGLPSVANLKIYTIDNTEGLKVSSTINGQENVNGELDKVTLKFTQPVAYAKVTSEAIAITENGEEFTDYTVGNLRTVDATVGGETYSEVDITFPNGLSFNADYVITVTDSVTNEIGTAIDAENNTVAFSTEAAPTFDVELKAYAGLSATGTELPALADGTTYFAVSAAYSEGKVIANGTVRLEIKDANGNVVKSVAAKKALGTGTATFGAAFKVEAGYTATVSIDGGIAGTATID